MSIEGYESAKVAPWAYEQCTAIERWQQCGWVHPLTCSSCSPSETLQVSANRLFCFKCGHEQDWVPACCCGPLPENPMDVINRLNGGQPAPESVTSKA